MKLDDSPLFFGAIEREDTVKNPALNFHREPKQRLTVTFRKFLPHWYPPSSKEDFPAWGIRCFLDYIKKPWRKDSIDIL